MAAPAPARVIEDRRVKLSRRDLGIIGALLLQAATAIYSYAQVARDVQTLREEVQEIRSYIWQQKASR